MPHVVVLTTYTHVLREVISFPCGQAFKKTSPVGIAASLTRCAGRFSPLTIFMIHPTFSNYEMIGCR